MSLVKQLVEEIEQIRKHKWKKISEEYPNANELKRICVWNDTHEYMALLTSYETYIGDEIGVNWVGIGGQEYYWGTNLGTGYRSLSDYYVYWREIDFEPPTKFNISTKFVKNKILTKF